MNKKDEAIATMEKAISYGAKINPSPFDYESMNKMLKEWKGE